jgi:hypothetical protein
LTDETRSKKTPVDPAGRVVHDARGNAVWKASRSFATQDTLHVLLHTDELALLEKSAAGVDPYAKDASSVVSGPAEEKRPRTDLRALSAKIVAERERKPR